jgi:hypothetical protein
MNLCQCRLFVIDRRLTKLENIRRTEQLMDRLPPNSFNYAVIEDMEQHPEKIGHSQHGADTH